MRYLVTGSGVPFYTNWFSIENTYSPGMVVFDLVNNLYYEGTGIWKKVECDRL